MDQLFIDSQQINEDEAQGEDGSSGRNKVKGISH
jgi:hypothetical protein